MRGLRVRITGAGWLWPRFCAAHLVMFLLDPVASWSPSSTREQRALPFDKERQAPVSGSEAFMLGPTR